MKIFKKIENYKNKDKNPFKKKESLNKYQLVTQNI